MSSTPSMKDFYRNIIEVIEYVGEDKFPRSASVSNGQFAGFFKAGGKWVINYHDYTRHSETVFSLYEDNVNRRHGVMDEHIDAYLGDLLNSLRKTYGKPMKFVAMRDATVELLPWEGVEDEPKGTPSDIVDDAARQFSALYTTLRIANNHNKFEGKVGIFNDVALSIETRGDMLWTYIHFEFPYPDVSKPPFKVWLNNTGYGYNKDSAPDNLSFFALLKNIRKVVALVKSTYEPTTADQPS